MGQYQSAHSCEMLCPSLRDAQGSLLVCYQPFQQPPIGRLCSQCFLVKAGSLFYFLFAEASEVATQPALRLDAADVLRLHRYTAFIALRHQGCTGMLNSIDGKKTNRKFPSRTVLTDRYQQHFGHPNTVMANRKGTSVPQLHVQWGILTLPPSFLPPPYPPPHPHLIKSQLVHREKVAI